MAQEMPQSNGSMVAVDPNISQQIDPAIAREIATKRQYIDQLRN